MFWILAGAASAGWMGRGVKGNCAWKDMWIQTCYFIFLLLLFSSYYRQYKLDFPGGSAVKNLPANERNTGNSVQSLGQEDPLEKEMATHSSILTCETPRREEPGGYSPWGNKKAGHNLATKQLESIGLNLIFKTSIVGSFFELLLWHPVIFY